MGKRIFLAIKINPEPELLDLFDLLRDELAEEQVKWVDEEQLHITLKFFGDMPDEKISILSDVVKNCCSEHPAFSFGLGSPGYFHKHQQPSVVFVKATGIEVMSALQAKLDKCFAELEIPEEEKPFRPHLTLGRLKSVNDLQAFTNLMKQFPPRTVQTVPVSELILYESFLKPSGPEYRILERFKLAEQNIQTNSK